MTIDNEVNHHIAEISGLKPEIHAFQRIYNPQTFYCRLRDMDIDEYHAKELSKEYEKLYDYIMKSELPYVKSQKKGVG